MVLGCVLIIWKVFKKYFNEKTTELTRVPESIMMKNTITMGDFNSLRGSDIAGKISDSDYGVANDQTPTRKAGDKTSFPQTSQSFFQQRSGPQSSA